MWSLGISWLSMKNRVLCVEDDFTIQALIRESLTDCDVIFANDLKEADRLITRCRYNLFLIDIELPDGDGLRYLARIMGDRIFDEWVRQTPTMILSSHSRIANKVMAFTLGAQDFISKPFDPVELNARVNARVRQHHMDLENARIRTLGNLVLDFDRQSAFVTDRGIERSLDLTPIEIKILALLTKRLDQVYSRDQIMNLVWSETFISDRTVDSHIAHLRRKIGATSVVIKTSKSFGYQATLKS